MSTDLVEKISERFREEITSHGMSLAEAARIAGEPGPQRIKDIVSGKQRCPSDLLARLAETVDVLYVLTGVRKEKPVPRRVDALIDNYEHLSEEDKRALERLAFSLAKQKVMEGAA
ncbi:MAG: helix-turn-helix domain-containing protein [Azoarcus sp.]|jgi:transcriptional regulator with XRE-family HTH domain|nr:helix-turn-helix domain-containing protein [Azoarcus sp.]